MWNCCYRLPTVRTEKTGSTRVVDDDAKHSCCDEFRVLFIELGLEVKTPGSKGKEAFQRPLRVTRAFTPTPASVTMPNDFFYQSSWYSHCQPLCSLTYSTGLLTHGQPLLAVTPLLTHGQPLLAVTPSGLRPSHHSAPGWRCAETRWSRVMYSTLSVSPFYSHSAEVFVVPSLLSLVLLYLSFLSSPSGKHESA